MASIGNCKPVNKEKESNMTNERFENLSDEVKAKLLACKTPEEVQEVAKAEGQELSLDDLKAVSGGIDSWECE